MHYLPLVASRISLLCLTLGPLARSGIEAAEKAQSPNSVVILTDYQSWVGSSVLMDPEDPRTRSDYYRTPNIERLVNLGMRFTRGYAPAPLCCPTRRSLLIGQTPARHIYQMDQENWTNNYRQQLSLPRMLKQANPNYRIAHFGKWDSRFDEVSPADVGYDLSDGTTGNGTGGSKGSGGPAAKDDPKLVFGVTQRACDFMERESTAGNLDEVGAETRMTKTKARQKDRHQTDSGRATELPALSRKKPNVLFLAIDDLNDWVGAARGHPQARTPNLDRLIAQSVFFSNAHSAAPVCSASRHALLSGLRPSTTGWYTNLSKSRDEYERTLGETVPMPTHFKRNGYKTMAAGKIFHKGTRDVKGYEYWDEERPKYKWPAELAERGHGYSGKRGGHFYPFPRDGGAIFQHYKSGVSGQSLCWGALEKEDMPPEGMPDEQVADWTVQRLKETHDKPFFLAVGFVRPHVPFTAPKKYFDLFPMSEVEMPIVPHDEMHDIPLLGKAMAYGTIQGGDHWNVRNIGPNYWRELVRAYPACVCFVDAQVGKVLDALDNSPYAENTLVVFWSDHGQHLGEKRHWRKMALWEESTRVPLAIRLPNSIRAGARCEQPVSLIDIYPTLIELCNLPEMKGTEGTSLLPQLADPRASRQEPAVTTWYYNNHAIRDLHWRYIHYRDGSEELYDHRKDPGEHINLAGDPAYAHIVERLSAYLPKTNVVPASMQKEGTDAFARKVEMLRREGVPPWLADADKAISVGSNGGL